VGTSLWLYYFAFVVGREISMNAHAHEHLRVCFCAGLCDSILSPTGWKFWYLQIH